MGEAGEGGQNRDREGLKLGKQRSIMGRKAAGRGGWCMLDPNLLSCNLPAPFLSMDLSQLKSWRPIAEWETCRGVKGKILIPPLFFWCSCTSGVKG